MSKETKNGRGGNIYGRPLKRALLGLTIGGAAALLSGCISVHKEVEQQPTPSPVIVVPNPPPNPPPP